MPLDPNAARLQQPVISAGFRVRVRDAAARRGIDEALMVGMVDACQRILALPTWGDALEFCERVKLPG